MAIEDHRQLKYREIYDFLSQEILTGKYRFGQNIPTERVLADHFGVSRPTVSRALRELEKAGLLEKRQRSGCFVKVSSAKSCTLGLLAPPIIPPYPIQMVFDSFVTQFTVAADLNQCRCIIANTSSMRTAARPEEMLQGARKACQELIQNRVEAVLYMPIEEDNQTSRINQHIVDGLRASGVQVVLLDRDIALADRRSGFDLVSLNHHQASYMLTRHLLAAGARRIYFAYHVLTSSVEARLFGYYHALRSQGITPDPRRVLTYDTVHTEHAKKLFQKLEGDAVVCVNDIMAAFTVQILQDVGLHIPQQIRVVGFDDMPMSKYLTPPLTTISQPVASMAEMCVKTLIQRIARPDLPAMDILLSPRLIVRKSCGASSRG